MSDEIEQEKRFQRLAIESAIRITAVAFLAGWCFLIVYPFIEPIVWAVIIAVATYPLFVGLRDKLLGGRNALAATLFSLVAIAILLVPTVQLTQSMFVSAERFADQFSAGEIVVPPPAESVKEWPLVGEDVYSTWLLASQNLEAAITKAEPKLKDMGAAIIGMAAGAGFGVLKFFLSLAIAGVLLANAESSAGAAHRLMVRLAGDQGVAFGQLAGATVRSVAQGVLGVAFIQAFLAGIGMLALGVPGAGLWALLVLMLAIVQLPPLLVLGPIMAYAFNNYDTLPAALFIAWSLVVSVSDSFLKPLLLGRGVNVPMLVIFIGAIGGFMLTGIIGLFTGAVVFVLGYTLFVAWLDAGDEADSVSEA